MARSILRRALLRGGAGIALALPALDAMFNGNGTAYADGAPLPVRFGIWFFGNGIRRDRWIPTTEGTGWTAPDQLKPLIDAGLREYVNVVSGFEMKTPFKEHHSGMTGITTGAPMKVIGKVRDTIASTVSQPTIDVVAAQHFQGQAPFKSLELGVCAFTGTDEGTTFQYLSMNGPNDPNPSERSPSKLFARLFSTTPGDPKAALIAKARGSVLDVVGEQIRALQGTVGAADRRRLEGHLESIRSIETRLQSQPSASCLAPARPTDPVGASAHDPIAEKNTLMSDLLAVALACDMSRVFSLMFETCGSQIYFWQTGATDGMHGMCHASQHDLVNKAVVFTMEQCAYFLKKLKDMPEGAGNVLDNCSLLVTSELSEGSTHSVDEFPIVTAGRAGGKLKTGIHYRSKSKENTTKALLSVLRAAGLPLTEFGYEQGRVTEGVTAIEA